MSARPQPEKTVPEPRAMTVPRFVEAKRRGERLCVLTAYDFLLAGILDAAGLDAILVGDSLGMVVQGKPTTLPVTLREMIYHAELVVRAAKRALVIVDMPFLSFHAGRRQAVRNAGLIIKHTGASCVKLEAGARQADIIRALVEADIPVMAHVGLKPQSVLALGGYKIQRDQERLLNDARAAEQAGAFAVVLECIPAGVARQVTQELSIPTIGIGAGPHCDGQVLVTQDMLGLTGDFRPRFVKPFANLRELALAACRQYIDEVRGGRWPDDQHSHA